MKVFDLNIDCILDNWNIEHAIREIIANANDESVLTRTAEPSIIKDDNMWIIRDYGRGISESNFVLNENIEKMNSDVVIGKFGVGLKDSLAILHKNNIKFTIVSKHGIYTLDKRNKHGFDDIKTLHVIVNDNEDKDFCGTAFIFDNLNDDDMFKAKQFFLKYLNVDLIDKTCYGDIYNKIGGVGYIFMNGIKIADDNYIFSYNITKITKKMRNAINRERTNVGRSAYSDRIKDIILHSNNQRIMSDIADSFVNDIGEEHNLADIRIHAIKILNNNQNVVFMTKDEMISNASIVDKINRSNKKIIIIDKKMCDKLNTIQDLNGNFITTSSIFSNDLLDHYCDVIPVLELTEQESNVFSYTSKLIEIASKFGLHHSYDIKIVNFADSSLRGLCRYDTREIYIARRCLNSVGSYAGTLLHEIIHETTHLKDVDRNFECELTNVIGNVCDLLLCPK